jgi:LAS superfamily LD-carboxypeptidase LdcB
MRKVKVSFIVFFVIIVIAVGAILVASGALDEREVEPQGDIFALDESGKSAVTEVKEPEPEEEKVEVKKASGGNCTTDSFGELMLINPNFTVTTNWIAGRKKQLISVSKTYGIKEGKSSNGDNLMDKTAAKHLNEMLTAYSKEYAGHSMVTRSCFRARGTTCGRLCAKTGTSDHHTGLTCDLIDPAYGTELNTAAYKTHIEWQWLRANSYKYGFIDRFPEAWAGGSMSQPINVDANGSTGLFETWHFRYVGVTAATEIATGKYNKGKYDSLEHYLKQIGKVKDLKNGKCE